MELKIGDYVFVTEGRLRSYVGRIERFDGLLLGPCRTVVVKTSNIVRLHHVHAYDLRLMTDVEILEYKLRGG